MKSFLYAFSSLAVGGQAVIEGVMMRSPNSMAVAVRRASGQIVIKEFQWVSLSGRFTFLKKPFFRGMLMLVEAMTNGMSALAFSAEQASLDDNTDAKKLVGEKKEMGQLGKGAIALSMVFAFGVGLFMFVVLPHLLTELIGRNLFSGGLRVDTFGFHLLDGLIKTLIFITYIVFIGRLPEIKRVFQYHGAEHKSIFNFEAGKELTTTNARGYSRFHPRCGTSFILTLILASILIFSVLFPMLPKPTLPPVLVSLLYASIKIPLMLPIVGLSYEFIRLMGSDTCPPWMKPLSKPGLWMQALTTQEPDEKQLEVGIASLKACLWREEILKNQKQASDSRPKDKLVSITDISSPSFEEKLKESV